MRRITRWRALLAGVLFAVIVVPIAVAGDIHTVDTTQPVVFVGANPCNGDPIQIDGHAHGVFDLTIGSGGKIHAVTMTFEFQGTGVNLAASGTRYQVVKRDFQQTNFDLPREEVTLDELMVVTRIGEDGVLADDFFMRLQAHLTISASGQVGASFLRPTVECR
jgi:hypothetical protein